jgi:hypothetical protein
MKRLFLFSLIFALESSFSYVDAVDIYSGTRPYVEVDTKYAFEVPKEHDLDSIGEVIVTNLKKFIESKSFHFPDQLNSRYHIVSSGRSYIYEDTYFDTREFLISKNRSSYRLRYRWKDSKDYQRYQVFPFLSKFYPIRCEIQAKIGYQKISHNQFSVEEYRFEFRDGSPPFLTQRAPSPPWKKSDFIRYAKEGRYKGYRLLPTYKVHELTGGKKLYKVLTAVNSRRRIHLEVENPWGVRPNPKQAIIITLDTTRVFKNKNFCQMQNCRDSEEEYFFEVEMEIDRSVLSQIVLWSNMGDLKGENISQAVYSQAQSNSKKAYKNLNDDIKLLRRELEKILFDRLKLVPLPLKSKYERYLGLLSK